MSSRWIQEYSIQTMLATLQSVVILFGIMATGAVLKARGYPEFEFPLASKVWFVRHWGLLLLIIPSGWVFVTVWLEERRDNGFTKEWSVATGIAVLAILVVFLFHTAILAGTRMGPIQSFE